MSQDLFRRYIDILDEAALPQPPGAPTGRKEMPAPRPATQDEINGLVPMSKSHTLAPDLMIYWWQDPKLKQFPKEMWQDLEKNLAAIREKHQQWPATSRPNAATPAATAPAAAPANPAVARPQSVLNRVRSDLAARNTGMAEDKSVELQRIREMAGINDPVGAPPSQELDENIVAATTALWTEYKNKYGI